MLKGEYDSDKPIYKHGCNNCIFICNISHRLRSSECLDAYFCLGSMLGGTIVLRHGDEPHEYYSSDLTLILRQNEFFKEIYSEVIRVGYEKEIIKDVELLKIIKSFIRIKL